MCSISGRLWATMYTTAHPADLESYCSTRPFMMPSPSKCDSSDKHWLAAADVSMLSHSCNKKEKGMLCFLFCRHENMRCNESQEHIVRFLKLIIAYPQVGMFSCLPKLKYLARHRKLTDHISDYENIISRMLQHVHKQEKW